MLYVSIGIRSMLIPLKVCVKLHYLRPIDNGKCLNIANAITSLDSAHGITVEWVLAWHYAITSLDNTQGITI